MNKPFGIEHKDIFTFDAERHVKIGAGDGSRTGSGNNDFTRGYFSSGQLAGVDKPRSGNNRRTVLVIMENGNIHFFFQAFFNIKAFGRFDIFQIDTAECRLKGFDDLTNFFRVFFGKLDIEHINIGKHFK